MSPAVAPGPQGVSSSWPVGKCHHPGVRLWRATWLQPVRMQGAVPRRPERMQDGRQPRLLRRHQQRGHRRPGAGPEPAAKREQRKARALGVAAGPPGTRAPGASGCPALCSDTRRFPVTGWGGRRRVPRRELGAPAAGPTAPPPQRWRGHPAAARCPGRASPFVVGLHCRSPVKAARGAGAGSRARVIIQSREVTPGLRGPSASGREREHGFPTPDCMARCAPCLAPGPWTVVAAGLVIGTPRGSVRRDFRPRWSPPGTLLGPPRRPGGHTATTRPEPLGPAGRPLPTETPRPTATRPLPPAALSEAQWRLV